MSDSTIEHLEGVVLMVLIVGCGLVYLISRLRRTRPGFDVRVPIAIGVALRLLSVAAINATSVQSQLRGGDETTFIDFAKTIATGPWGSGFLPHSRFQLQTDVFAVQLKLLPLNNTALRVTQIGIAMLGIVLIAVAVYDLAGVRASRFAMWLMACEPSNVFFNSALHKEPLMVLASGLIVFGGAKVWQRLGVSGIVLAALGGLIAIETRSYAGWFLVSAFVLLLLVAGIRHLDHPVHAMPIVYAVVLTIFLVTPTLISVSSNQSLKRLQISQDANSQQPATAAPAEPNGNNLALEKVDFSTRGALISSLPQRMTDLTFKPFPWQVQDISQQLGALGTLIWLTGLVLLIRYVWASRGEILTIGAPILSPMMFLLIAYSLSAGNAGTGFRYRSHLVLLAAAMLAVLRESAAVARSRSVDGRISPGGAGTAPVAA